MQEIPVFEVVCDEVNWFLGGAATNNIQNIWMVPDIQHKSYLSQKLSNMTFLAGAL